MEKGLSNILLQYHSDRREEGGRGIGLSMSNALQVLDTDTFDTNLLNDQMIQNASSLNSLKWCSQAND